MVIKTYKELIVWQKSMDLVVLVYKYTASFPKSEIYSLVMQLRRCSISIPSNIAEGWTRKNTKEYLNFLSISNGSASELETQLILSGYLGFGDSTIREKCLALDIEIQKMLAGMISGLKNSLR